MKDSSSSEEQHCHLLGRGWRLDNRVWPIMIGLLALTPLVSFALPEGEHMLAWQRLLFGMQMFGLGLYAAQCAPIWTSVPVGEDVKPSPDQPPD
ncbi:hypothetical protein [Geopseudomonas aromaticivorans]